MEQPTETNLAHLEVLREFKRKMPQASQDVNISPFDHRISTAVERMPRDISDMHAEVRVHIRDTISAVRQARKQSQVILLSGAAGVGKTHLLRSFQAPDLAEQEGYIFVGGSNHWKIGEFQEQILDWIISALTAPSPTEEHPLLERIRAIGFRAMEHLLNNPKTWKTCLARTRGGFLSWFVPRWSRPAHERLLELTRNRNPEVFRHVDFTAFGNYVCDRFLAERSNLLHRYALRVLLTYLFPDKQESGVGTRERVLHWFRGKADEEYFIRRLGASERPDRAYSQFEAVKLLSHLFSPEVSAQLSTESHPCSPRVFLLTFDQSEGRNELFERDDDWHTFFAHLSELYNTLPNVVVLFTMTLGLRNRLHAIMERQFRDRVRMDERFTLSFPTAEQFLQLYRSRIEQWIEDDPLLLDRYRTLDNSFVPFSREEVIAAGNQSIRDSLARLDEMFRAKIRDVAVDAMIDYLFERNERTPREALANEWDYTAQHLETVRHLLESVGSQLASDAGIEIRNLNTNRVENNFLVQLAFGIPNQPHFVNFSLARLGFQFNDRIESLIKGLLYGREKAKNFLWVVRPQPFPGSLSVVSRNYHSQFFSGVCSPDIESIFAALTAVQANRARYDTLAQQTALDELTLREINGTYLGQLFRQARAQLDALASGTIAPELDNPNA